MNHTSASTPVSVPVLFENPDLLICEKPAGVECEHDLPALLQSQLGLPVYAVHRLDQNVGGLMVYAKTRPAAASLARLMEEKGTPGEAPGIRKEYVALCHGCPEQEGDGPWTLTDLLFKDPKKNKVFVVRSVRRGVREARLRYTVKWSEEDRALVRITLDTGRSHQIRVQFASRHCPL
ncbi:MAG: RNA pseudouridine synthase, partial [Clostridia bacterium]|nr:RNA pseudouridine synthase [Clostridia bacterium]